MRDSLSSERIRSVSEELAHLIVNFYMSLLWSIDKPNFNVETSFIVIYYSRQRLTSDNWTILAREPQVKYFPVRHAYHSGIKYIKLWKIPRISQTIKQLLNSVFSW